MDINIKDLQRLINDAVAVKARANKELVDLQAIAIDLGYVIGDNNELIRIRECINN
jgi:hypothetical protein